MLGLSKRFPNFAGICGTAESGGALEIFSDLSNDKYVSCNITKSNVESIKIPTGHICLITYLLWGIYLSHAYTDLVCFTVEVLIQQFWVITAKACRSELPISLQTHGLLTSCSHH